MKPNNKQVCWVGAKLIFMHEKTSSELIIFGSAASLKQ